MKTLETLIKAIENRHHIAYQYNKPGKVFGGRIGHPYAVYIHTAKNTKIQSTKVHIVQIEGVSDTEPQKPFPSFRTYDLIDLSDLIILSDRPCFSEPWHEHYNPLSDCYKDVIIKI
jgi:hypothetical protein